ncbi:type I-C CRISPR-associated protein Cas8c/Csd1 [Clostridium sp.]|uniref:type I-C CRISPR-associated protein Cas8c/Csd1 n=1 Tax=Clostridium sp. TaxID=1506 RepID=UPI0026355F80|nr:type I-C CRISPR-associated protein Cas8c/Csd1 [Clostridium sp.]
MVLQALYKYYDILDKEGTEGLPKEGFSVQKVSFAFVISLNGELKDIVDLRKFNSNKLLLQEMLVPEQRGRGGPNTPSYFLCDNVKYVLGIGDEENLPSFNSFKKLHNKYLESNNPLLKFINSFEPSKAFENEIILKYKDEFKSNSNIVFRIEGEDCYLHEKEELLKAWREDNSKETDEISMQCLITGEVKPIARVHIPIKGVRNAHPSGASIVTFNDDSSKFYGKKLGYNAPISKSAMFKYTSVLNHLLRNDKNHIFIGDDTVVFWAGKKGIYEDLLVELLNPTIQDEERTETFEINVRDLAKEILNKYSKGINLNEENYDIDFI